MAMIAPTVTYSTVESWCHVAVTVIGPFIRTVVDCVEDCVDPCQPSNTQLTPNIGEGGVETEIGALVPALYQPWPEVMPCGDWTVR